MLTLAIKTAYPLMPCTSKDRNTLLFESSIMNMMTLSPYDAIQYSWRSLSLFVLLAIQFTPTV